ncbi:hypothetical protein [Peterkaempfera bronchialis]|uniref:Uncharacterized protein n=1 Tax=Peterkaempfera bronchialis TaxID=2126346 RepID=A0A345SSC4_9ACTN|nr:hypothetical protein [Peterkaempfera bronchialis]AXI76629.1 hypothetical protein C7M71_003250 [Peterkaempfera bronchialis]
MPGSVTISHQHQAVMISYADAKRLAAVLEEVSGLLDDTGSDQLSDAQVTALCEGHVHHRDEFAHWIRTLAADLRGKV